MALHSHPTLSLPLHEWKSADNGSLLVFDVHVFSKCFMWSSSLKWWLMHARRLLQPMLYQNMTFCGALTLPRKNMFVNSPLDGSRNPQVNHAFLPHLTFLG